MVKIVAESLALLAPHEGTAEQAAPEEHAVAAEQYAAAHEQAARQAAPAAAGKAAAGKAAPKGPSKPQFTASAQTTLAMYEREGLSLEAIAARRGLKLSSVITHLAAAGGRGWGAGRRQEGRRDERRLRGPASLPPLASSCGSCPAAPISSRHSSAALHAPSLLPALPPLSCRRGGRAVQLAAAGWGRAAGAARRRRPVARRRGRCHFRGAAAPAAGRRRPPGCAAHQGHPGGARGVCASKGGDSWIHAPSHRLRVGQLAQPSATTHRHPGSCRVSPPCRPALPPGPSSNPQVAALLAAPEGEPRLYGAIRLVTAMLDHGVSFTLVHEPPPPLGAGPPF